MDDKEKAEFTAVINRLRINNEITARYLLAKRLTDGHVRDIETECGYPTDVTATDYHDMYKRGDVARRVICVYPDYCWKEPPEVFEVEEDGFTPFEEGWNALIEDQKLCLFQAMRNVDVLAGIGQFGVLFLGFADGKNFDQPVVDGKELLYLQAFDERKVTIKELVKDTKDPRFSQPLFYDIKMSDGNVNGETVRRVHYSRIIHVADGATESPVYGTPRLEAVYNRFLDIKKILGGSAEMFWKGGFPGTVFNLDPEAETTEASTTEMKEQIHRWEESLSRVLRLQGVDAKQLTVEIASPTEPLRAQFEAISATTGIPLRVLFGSEQAQLASTQDRRNWYDRVQARRENYCTPQIISPIAQRLIDVKVLPAPKIPFKVNWAFDNMLDDKEKADLARVKTEAIARYADSPMASTIVPPNQFLTRVLGFSIAEAEAIMEDVTQEILDDASEKDDTGSDEPSTKGY